jgi:hypothetical protein
MISSSKINNSLIKKHSLKQNHQQFNKKASGLTKSLAGQAKSSTVHAKS